MWLACEVGRLAIFLAALVWMLWFTHRYSPWMRRVALAFYLGVALEMIAVIGHLQRALCMTFLVRGDALSGGILTNLGAILILGSVFTMMLDITRASQRHKREAETDPLTSLFNRRVFFARAEHALSDARAGLCKPSVAVLDVDRMKEINDLYGHQCGDEVLRQAAKAIGQSVRHDDIPARHGGDEFAILFRHTGPHLETLKARLGQYLEDVRACKEGIPVSLSIGVARYPVDGQDIDSLLYVADTRMYSDKATKSRRGTSAARAPQS